MRCTNKLQHFVLFSLEEQGLACIFFFLIRKHQPALYILMSASSFVNILDKAYNKHICIHKKWYHAMYIYQIGFSWHCCTNKPPYLYATNFWLWVTFEICTWTLEYYYISTIFSLYFIFYFLNTIFCTKFSDLRFWPLKKTSI